MIETQQTLNDWADETFGKATDLHSTFYRMLDEWNELNDAIHNNKTSEEIAEELADILMMLYRMADVLNVDLHDIVDRKMIINRARKWKLDSHGHGQHIK